jgi:hypothetical protein
MRCMMGGDGAFHTYSSVGVDDHAAGKASIECAPSAPLSFSQSNPWRRSTSLVPRRQPVRFFWRRPSPRTPPYPPYSVRSAKAAMSERQPPATPPRSDFDEAAGACRLKCDEMRAAQRMKKAVTKDKGPVATEDRRQRSYESPTLRAVMV